MPALPLSGNSLRVNFSLCAGIGFVQHPMVVSDGLWHTVRWSQAVQRLTLVVDSTMPVQGVIPGDFTSLDVHQNGTAFVHLGGLADFQQIPMEGEYMLKSLLFYVCIS